MVIVIAVAFAILGYAVWEHRGTTLQSASLTAPPSDNPVHEISFPRDEPDLPPGPGREQYTTHCVICHSPRYVSNQPLLPRKTWESEVHKMVAKYGAPIPAADESKIVDYIVSWQEKSVGTGTK